MKEPTRRPRATAANGGPLRPSLLVLAAIAVAAAAGVAATGSLGGDSANSQSAAPWGRRPRRRCSGPR
ncbi:hypothetical protein SALBM135S_01141 [Streptomyces alboniger]